jgi:hypothetical protein
LVVVGAGAAGFFFFLLLVFLAGFGVVVAGVVAAGVVSAAIGAADFGISADIAADAMPKVNNAALIRVPDLVMRSPSGGINKHFEEYPGTAPDHPR